MTATPSFESEQSPLHTNYFINHLMNFSDQITKDDPSLSSDLLKASHLMIDSWKELTDDLTNTVRINIEERDLCLDSSGWMLKNYAMFTDLLRDRLTDASQVAAMQIRSGALSDLSALHAYWLFVGGGLLAMMDDFIAAVLIPLKEAADNG